MKFTPPSSAAFRVLAVSYAACASGSLDPHSPPPDRNGTPRRRANCPAPHRILVASGVPKVGAPEFMSIEVTNAPKMIGAPGRINCEYAIPASTSASTWVSVPATDTGAMAPPTMNGEMMQA